MLQTSTVPPKPFKAPAAFTARSSGTSVNTVWPKSATLAGIPAALSASSGALHLPSVRPRVYANWNDISRNSFTSLDSDSLASILPPRPLISSMRLARNDLVDIGAMQRMTAL